MTQIPTAAISRRAALAALTSVTGMVAGSAFAAPAASAHERPARIDLPAGLRPEGITSGPDDRFYVGSLADGRLLTGSLRRGTTRVLLAGATGRSLRGLFFDRRTELVWAVGSQGATGLVLAVHSRSGRVFLSQEIAGAGFLNDVVVTERAAWVTDSAVDRLTRVPLGAKGWPNRAEPTFVALGAPWPTPDGFRANGIRELPDGTLLLDHSTSGGLWQVRPRPAAVRAIPVTGAPAIVSGDGLELRGRTAYVVRGSGGNDVTVVELERSGGVWSGRVTGVLSSPDLDVPSTATLAGGALWAVNARFGVANPDTAAYWATRLDLRHH